MADAPAPHSIAIIGAGVAGPILALTIVSNSALRKRYHPVIYERLPCPKSPTSSAPFVAPQGDGGGNLPDTHSTATYAAGAAVALTSNALYPLYALGLQEALDSISCETRRIKIWRA